MSRSMPVVAVALCALGSIACGGDAKTPQAALQKLLDAAAAGNAAGFREGFPSREELSKMFECPDGVDLAGRYDELSAEFVAWRDARPLLAAGGLTVADRRQVMAGEAVGGCTARQALGLVRADVSLTEPGGNKHYAVRFVELDGKVSILAF